MASPTGPWGSLSTCLRESQATLVGNRVPVMSVQLRAWIVLGASWGTSPSSPGGIHSDIGGGGTWHVALGSGLDLFCLGPGVLASPVHSRGRCVLRLQGSGQGAPRGSRPVWRQQGQERGPRSGDKTGWQTAPAPLRRWARGWGQEGSRAVPRPLSAPDWLWGGGGLGVQDGTGGESRGSIDPRR